MSHTYHRLRTNNLQLKARFFFIGSANLINSDSRRIDPWGLFSCRKDRKGGWQRRFRCVLRNFLCQFSRIRATSINKSFQTATILLSDNAPYRYFDGKVIHSQALWQVGNKGCILALLIFMATMYVCIPGDSQFKQDRLCLAFIYDKKIRFQTGHQNVRRDSTPMRGCVTGNVRIEGIVRN